MATVIDHVILELGLDTKKFDEGIKKNAEAWLKLRQSAEQNRKDTEGPIDSMGKAFVGLTTKIAGFVAALVTLQKIIQFTTNLTRTNVSLANLSTTTQISVEKLSAAANMAERYGSSAESMTQAIANMDAELKKIQITGSQGSKLAILVNSLNKMQGGIANIKPPQDAKDALEMYDDILKGMERLGFTAKEKSAFFNELGLNDQSITALFIRHSSADLRRMLDEQKDIYVVTQQNTDEALELSKAWNELEQRGRALGLVIMNDLSKPLINAINAANKFMETGSLPKEGFTGEGHDTFTGMADEAAKQRQRRKERIDDLNRRLQNRQAPFSDPAPITPKPQVPATEELMPRTNPRQPLSPANGQSFRGAASFYSGLPHEGGNKTSTGERVDPNSYTGALQSGLAKQYGGLRKGGIWADVTDERTGKKVRVYLNDTGPLRPGRVVDLSPKAFGEFAPLGKGVQPNMRVDVLPPAPQGKPYKGGPVSEDENPWHHGSPPIPWLSNPRLLRSPRFNQMLNPTQNYATSEMTVHSLIVNSKPVTDDAYGLAADAIPQLERGLFMSQMSEGQL